MLHLPWVQPPALPSDLQLSTETGSTCIHEDQILDSDANRGVIPNVKVELQEASADLRKTICMVCECRNQASCNSGQQPKDVANCCNSSRSNGQLCAGVSGAGCCALRFRTPVANCHGFHTGFTLDKTGFTKSIITRVPRAKEHAAILCLN